MTGEEERVPTAQSLGRRAVAGARVVMLGQVAKVLIQLLSVVVLARLLAPSAYGLFALALAVISLGEVFRDFGLSSAAIQAPRLTRGQQSNLLWLNLALGTLLAGVCAAAAPLVGRIGASASAVALVQALSLAFVLNGLQAQYRADLSRRLKFGSLAAADVAGQAAGVGLAIVAAAAGWGVWALAVQQLTGLTVTSLLVMRAAGWLPRAPDRREDVRPLVRFGLGMVGTQLVGYLDQNIDTYTVGIRFGTTSLGLYNRAYQVLMQTLNQFRNPTTSVAVPILAKVRGGGPEADVLVQRGQAVLGYTLVAGTAFAAGAAEPIVALALGPAWAASAPLVAALAWAGAFQTIGYVAYWVYVSRGLSMGLFRLSVLSVAIRIVCVLVGSHWGVLGVAIGYAVAPAVTFPLSYWRLSRVTPMPLGRLLVGAVRVLLCAGLSAGCVHAAQQGLSGFSPPLQIAGGLLAWAGAYLVLAGIPSVRGDLRGLLAVARMVRGARRGTR